MISCLFFMKKAGDQPCLKYLTCDGFLNFSNDIFHSYIHLLTISCLEFNLAVFDSLTDCNTVWDTDQFHILELDTRSFITVIQNDFIAFASKIFIDALCFLNLLGILCGNDDDGNLIWRNFNRPVDAVFICVLLSKCSHGSGWTDTIGTHPYILQLVIGIKIT